MKKKIIAILLSSIIFTVIFAGCEVNTTPKPPQFPDAGKMIFYGYSGPTDGTYSIDGITYFTGEDFRSYERYLEYAESGMNVLLLQGNDPYGGEEWETSQTKRNMDNAHQASLKVIVFDSRLHDFSHSMDSLIGQNKSFADTQAFEEYVEFCLKDYSQHPAFYGIQLRDEPHHRMLTAMGQTYKAVKKIVPDAFVQCNLLPFSHYVAGHYSANAADTTEKRYADYIELFLQETGANYIMFDSYPMQQNNNGEKNISASHLITLRIVAEKAKEHNVEIYAVAQTCSFSNAGDMKTRRNDKSEMYWQNNLYLGYGVKHISYFTYWRKQNNSTSGEFFFDDGSSIMRQDGTRSNLYYYLQSIHKEFQKFAPVFLNFNFNASNYFMGQPMAFPIGYLMGALQNEFDALKNVEVGTGELAFVTELIDGKGHYMYMVQNLIDPANSFKGETGLNVTLTFDSKYKNVLVYYRGEPLVYSLENGKYSTVLAAGFAEFVIPF